MNPSSSLCWMLFCRGNFMNIIHFGPQDIATSWQRIQAFRDLGHNVDIVYYSRMGERLSLPRRVYRALRRRIGCPAEQCAENRTLLEMAISVQPDIIFIEKGLTLRPSTLERLKQVCPRTVLVCYSLDDMMNPANQSRYYLKCLPLYDIHFTTKTYNIDELLACGARRVELTGNAYSPCVHRPITCSTQEREAYGSEVSFVGGYEYDRAQTLNYLADAGVEVRVWGNNWHKFINPHPRLRLEKRPAYGEDYGKVVCASKILLGFLRKVNRDVETTRSMEIPAYGAFLLAERTVAQQNLFKEGKEAAYFGDDRELLEKIHYYLKNEEQRRAIAAAGRQRCLTSGYSYNDRLRDLLEVCTDIAKEKDGGR
ncbi:MAG: hypothetical protein CVU69_02350 [Deltaproteobacteria bacterium HGW-Deltaproteobacteria-4]|nr:MAG: hypothetical protein CVU69_02350 [Deltaproteobacteria bacterium HGW-Deltaproteobacteria-4]